MNGQKTLRKIKRFVYLISPNKIKNTNKFLFNLKNIFKTNCISYFQLRLKNSNLGYKYKLSIKIKKITKKYSIKFIVNDDPYLAKKVGADGCHLGQSDMDIIKAKKIIGRNKIIGITCHNSKSLIEKAIKNKANYVALGAFNKSLTKKVKYRAQISILKWAKSNYKIKVVAIGGINDKNYKKLLLNNADFLAISDYVWNNKKLNPQEATKKLL